jgi:hypothetical protein
VRDLAFALETISTSGTNSAQSLVLPPAILSSPGSRLLRDRLPWVVALLILLLTTITLAALYFRRAPAEARSSSVRFLVYPPEKGTFFGIPNISSVISPDGRRLALVVTTEGRTQLYMRALDSALPKPIAGTDHAYFPFWSPDSRSLGLFAEGKLKRVEVGGGSHTDPNIH